MIWLHTSNSSSQLKVWIKDLIRELLYCTDYRNFIVDFRNCSNDKKIPNGLTFDKPMSTKEFEHKYITQFLSEGKLQRVQEYQLNRTL